ncbi:MAG: hypothetical protein ACLR23_15610 [Clostridia bacterium]
MGALSVWAVSKHSLPGRQWLSILDYLEFCHLRGLVCFFQRGLQSSTLAAFHHGKISVVYYILLLGGMILPALYGVIGLGETVPPKGWVAIGVMICALIPSKKKKREHTKYRVSFYILCLAVFFANGLISVVTKYHQIMENAASENEFLIFSSWMTIALSAVMLRFTERQKGGGTFSSLRMIPPAAMGMMLGYAVLNTGEIYVLCMRLAICHPLSSFPS